MVSMTNTKSSRVARIRLTADVLLPEGYPDVDEGEFTVDLGYAFEDAKLVFDGHALQLDDIAVDVKAIREVKA